MAWTVRRRYVCAWCMLLCNHIHKCECMHPLSKTHTLSTCVYTHIKRCVHMHPKVENVCISVSTGVHSAWIYAQKYSYFSCIYKLCIYDLGIDKVGRCVCGCVWVCGACTQYNYNVYAVCTYPQKFTYTFMHASTGIYSGIHKYVFMHPQVCLY